MRFWSHTIVLPLYINYKGISEVKNVFLKILNGSGPSVIGGGYDSRIHQRGGGGKGLGEKKGIFYKNGIEENLQTFCNKSVN